MHELAVTQSLLETALRHARREGAVRVTRLRLVLGDLSTFVDESVRFYWNIVSKDTLCEGAELEFRRTPARFSCRSCGTEYAARGELAPCPRCGGEDVRVAGGDEFHLESMDIEMAEEGPRTP
ncbi:MAG: hydrogenase maturation nickel metallochaperone HypA [Planctomycetota bacterium]